MEFGILLPSYPGRQETYILVSFGRNIYAVLQQYMSNRVLHFELFKNHPIFTFRVGMAAKNLPKACPRDFECPLCQNSSLHAGLEWHMLAVTKLPGNPLIPPCNRVLGGGGLDPCALPFRFFFYFIFFFFCEIPPSGSCWREEVANCLLKLCWIEKFLYNLLLKR